MGREPITHFNTFQHTSTYLGVPALRSLWFLILLSTLFLHIKKKNPYFWLLWVFAAVHGLFSSCGARASHCGGFSCGGAGSRRTGFSSRSTWAQQLCSRALEHRLSSRGAWLLPRAFEIFLYQGSNPSLLHW